MATKQIVGFRTDEMVQAGLADNFDGTITLARYCEWNYKGKSKATFAVHLEITPQGGGEAIDAYYSAGDPNNWQPSNDGVDALESGEEGIYPCKIGTQDGLPNSSNFHFFMSTLEKLGYDGRDPSIASLEGLTGHFQRVPQPTRPGISSTTTTQSGEQREKTILVVTNIISKGGGKAAKGAAKAKTNGAETPATGGGDLAERVSSFIMEHLAEAADNTAAKKDVTSAVIQNFNGPEKTQAVKLMSQQAFLTGGDWTFNADNGTLSL